MSSVHRPTGSFSQEFNRPTCESNVEISADLHGGPIGREIIVLKEIISLISDIYFRPIIGGGRVRREERHMCCHEVTKPLKVHHVCEARLSRRLSLSTFRSWRQDSDRELQRALRCRVKVLYTALPGESQERACSRRASNLSNSTSKSLCCCAHGGRRWPGCARRAAAPDSTTWNATAVNRSLTARRRCKGLLFSSRSQHADVAPAAAPSKQNVKASSRWFPDVSS